jgi:PAS domain S-box-containing protein
MGNGIRAFAASADSRFLASVSSETSGPSLSTLAAIFFAAFGAIGILFLVKANRRLRTKLEEQEEREKALRQSEQRWSYALDGSREGVWDWNLPAATIFFSRQWKALLGHEDHEIQNDFEEWTKRIHPDDLDLLLDAIQYHLRGKTPHFEVEHRMQVKDGGYKWFLSRGRIVSRTSEGKPERFVGTYRDIQSRHQAEDELRRYRERLEDQLQIRTHELAKRNEELRKLRDATPG